MRSFEGCYTCIFLPDREYFLQITHHFLETRLRTLMILKEKDKILSCSFRCNKTTYNIHRYICINEKLQICLYFKHRAARRRCVIENSNVPKRSVIKFVNIRFVLKPASMSTICILQHISHFSIATTFAIAIGFISIIRNQHTCTRNYQARYLYTLAKIMCF